MSEEGITTDVMVEQLSDWFKQRVEAYNTAAGWSGRNLLDNTVLASTVVGIEEDITFLLRLNRNILLTIKAMESQPTNEVRAKTKLNSELAQAQPQSTKKKEKS